MKRIVKKSFSEKWGFTLVEMVVVIAIIVILAVVVFFSVAKYLTAARSATSKIDAHNSAIEEVYAGVSAVLEP